MTSGGYDPNKNPQGEPYGQQPYPQGGQPNPQGDPYGQPPQDAPPQYGQPQYQQPQYGQDPYGQPQYSQDPYAQPQYGQDPYAQQQGYGQPYGQGYTYSGFGTPADLGVRVGARVIDTLIVLVPVNVIMSLIYGSGTGFFVGVSVVGAIALTLYFVLMETQQGTTLGKKLLGLRVLGPNGAPKVTAEQSLKRNLYTLVYVFPCIGQIASLALIIYMMITTSQDPNKQGWHDKFAGGTQVVKA
ncbi:RDD family protein [Nocardia sp. XZ_19_385]|uniref:RDD family protein n=1 Tax=Nocardia sp. XZ_19_385 TaxID=2769488 RepID=UPI00188EF6AE|nr:RDD family protein [Nocardia sp. XZ_19_385]